MVLRFFLFYVVFIVLISCSTIPSKDKISKNASVSDKKESFLTIAVPGRPRNPILNDIDKDSVNELIIVAKSPWLYVFDVNDKTFYLKKRHDVFTHNTYLLSVDIDNDGDIDLIPITESLIGPFLLNDGKGKFNLKNISLKSPKFGIYLSASDINLDSHQDLLAVGFLDEQVYLYLNQGKLNFKLYRLLPPKSNRYFGNQKGMKEIRPIVFDNQKAFLISDYFGQRVLLLKMSFDNNLEYKFYTLYESHSTISSSLFFENTDGNYLVVCEEASKRLVFLKRDQSGSFVPFKTVSVPKAFPRKLLRKDNFWVAFWINPGKTIIQLYHNLDLIRTFELNRRRCEDGFIGDHFIWCADVYNNEIVGVGYATEK